MTARITFRECIQDSQDYGSDDEHMVSRVFFTLELGGRSYPDLYADIKQTVGSSFETGTLEVDAPHGYKGPFNQASFRDAVEAYCRSLVGATGSGIRIEGAVNLRMRNNRFVRRHTVEFPVTEGGAGW